MKREVRDSGTHDVDRHGGKTTIRSFERRDRQLSACKALLYGTFMFFAGTGEAAGTDCWLSMGTCRKWASI